jgi:thiopeptide-type bacteriocin biosynthesis protein
VICRPALREYEITFAGHSGLPPAQQIPASDLMLSLRDGRLELHSARLGRRIIPRLTTAHNFGRGLTAYRFLCQLQMQGTLGVLLWQWGPLAASAFLPRVRHGRIVLSLARWTLSKAEIASLHAGDRVAQGRAMTTLRQARGLPRWVVLREADNRLPVDLDNPLAVEMLLHELHEWPSAVLEELWPEDDRLLASGPEGQFRHELIVPFTTREEPRRAAPSLPVSAAPVLRRFTPGSEWLYLKLYCSPVAADTILIDLVGPQSARWSARGVDRWFFLRYQDPEPHLRWRMHGDPQLLQRKVWPAIQKALEPLLQAGAVRRIQLDTYEREVERYGGSAAIEVAEQLFHHDSIAVTGLLGQLEPGDAGLEERWQLALRGSDQLMDDFGLDRATRLSLLERMAAYGSVPVPDSYLRQQLSGKFRARRSTVERVLDRTQDGASPLAPGFEILAQRSAAHASGVTGLQGLAVQGALSESLENIVGSLIHMQVNRLLRESPNAHETVLYDWLRRVYQSQLAREKGRATSG